MTPKKLREDLEYIREVASILSSCVYYENDEDIVESVLKIDTEKLYELVDFYDPIVSQWEC